WPKLGVAGAESSKPRQRSWTSRGFEDSAPATHRFDKSLTISRLEKLMRFQGKFLGLLVYALIAVLVAGGLGWVTCDALRMEQERWAARADAQYNDQLHLALWRLDGRISPVLVREDSRPYNHFSAVYAPTVALQGNGMMCATGSVLEISPLV